MSKMDEVADLISIAMAATNLEVMMATLERALQLADEDLSRADVTMVDAERLFLKAQHNMFKTDFDYYV